MKILDQGVVDPSFMDFTIPSHFAKKALYTIPQYGHFYCTKDYYISRESLNLFLLVYVCSGSFHLKVRGQEVTARNDEIILLDCHDPHTYYCTEPSDFLWFHFIGNNSQDYADFLFEKTGLLFQGSHIPSLKPYFESVLSRAQAIVTNEHRISSHITRILSGLAVTESQQMIMSHPLSPSIRYISKHYDEEIRLEDLAELCSLSVSHFIRSFRAYAGCTPHEYLLSFRLRQAKQMLLLSSKSVEEIGISCGFNSASHFARAFRKQEGISPSEFRKIQF